MANFTLKQLRYFEALAKHGHFGRAADYCAISQPALSMQIKELEDALGSPLFERNAREVRLTGFGEEFSLRVRDILRSVDELGEMVLSARGRLAGRLRIGVIPTIAPYLLPKLIRDLNDRYSGVDLHVRETQTANLLSDLHEGRLDTAILALPISDPALHELTLFDEEFVLVRPRADAGKPVPDPERLSEMRLLLLEEGHCFRDQALSLCNIQPSVPKELFDGSSLTTLVQMVGAGLGVTLIPEMSVPLETRFAEVSVDRFPSATPARTIGMIWRKSSPLAPHLADMAEVVRLSAGH
ncbi:MAG: LysR substrate-binding domain-containing protein [Paracoccaceae bacterium]|jgi:LysR family hydrogen peroxide-inducible transcriptional activator|nr:LysR substrate-binding domain-containing protein [Paracoccaceae bacterium]MDP7186517.1 LysR substrate-binding domain-containing protein [Paracoccaceae bacterium]